MNNDKTFRSVKPFDIKRLTCVRLIQFYSCPSYSSKTRHVIGNALSGFIGHTCVCVNPFWCVVDHFLPDSRGDHITGVASCLESGIVVWLYFINYRIPVEEAHLFV